MSVAELVRVVEAVELFEQDEEVLWGWESEIDDRTCDFCRDMHGKTLTQDEVISRFPYLERDTYVWRPNPHPHCRCRLIRLVAIR